MMYGVQYGKITLDPFMLAIFFCLLFILGCAIVFSLAIRSAVIADAVKALLRRLRLKEPE